MKKSFHDTLHEDIFDVTYLSIRKTSMLEDIRQTGKKRKHSYLAFFYQVSFSLALWPKSLI